MTFLIQSPFFSGDYIYNFIKLLSLYISHIQINWLVVWLEFYFCLLKCPPKFKRTGSAYIFFSIIHFVCDIFFFLVQFCYPIVYRTCFVSSKTISYKETHHFYQKKNEEKKYNLTLSIEMWRFLFSPPLF